MFLHSTVEIGGKPELYSAGVVFRFELNQIKQSFIGFQPVMILTIRLWRRGHDGVPGWGGAGIRSYFVLPKSIRRLDNPHGTSGTFFLLRKNRKNLC